MPPAPTGVRLPMMSTPEYHVTDPLSQVFADGLGLDPAEITEQTSPDNTPQWDSLAAMSLVSLIEDTFQVRLTTRDIMRMRTVALAREVLKAKGIRDL